MTEYNFKGSLDLEDGSEVDFVLAYKVSPGLTATPPAYDHGGMPAEEPDVYDIRVASCSVHGVNEEAIIESVSAEELLLNASEEDQYRLELAADHRRDY